MKGLFALAAIIACASFIADRHLSVPLKAVLSASAVLISLFGAIFVQYEMQATSSQEGMVTVVNLTFAKDFVNFNMTNSGKGVVTGDMTVAKAVLSDHALSQEELTQEFAELEARVNSNPKSEAQDPPGSLFFTSADLKSVNQDAMNKINRGEEALYLLLFAKYEDGKNPGFARFFYCSEKGDDGGFHQCSRFNKTVRGSP